MSKTIWLIDIDGTICEDIPNEESYRFFEAKPNCFTHLYFPVF